jgi:hypothetical protein
MLINNSLSGYRHIKAGVPQGSSLSPILFALYINNIGRCLDKCKVKYTLYADDLLVWYTHKSINIIKKELQIAINITNSFMQKSKLKINEKKTQYLLLSRRGNCQEHKNNPDILKLKIKNQPIERCLYPRFLGITLDSTLNFEKHFSEIIKKCTSKINMISILSSKAFRINKANLLTIYKSFILSLFQYSMLPYLSTTSATQRKLQTIQNRVLKTILKLPAHTNTTLIHNMLTIETLDKRLKSLATSYLTKASNTNETIADLITNHTFSDELPRTPLDQLLQ